MKRVVVLGSGNIANYVCTQLALQKEYKIVQLYARNKNTGIRFQEHFNIPVVNNLDALDTKAEVYIFAINDNAIDDLANQLQLNNALLIHCAGSRPVNLLQAASNNNGVIWPIYSITNNRNVYSSAIPLIIDGNSVENIKQTQLIANVISNNVTLANFEQRQYLHLNAVLVNNFTNHLMAIAQQISIENNLTFDILKPIIHQTVDRIATQNPADVQTGPAIREDIETQNKHLQLLINHKMWQKVYESMSASIKEMYTTKGDKL